MLTPSRSPRRPRPRLLAACLLAVVLASCGNTTVSPTPTGTSSPSTATSPSSAASSPTASVDPAAVYASIEQQVVAIRGLQSKTDVHPQVLDATELADRVEKAFTKDNPPDVIRTNELLLKGLGLFPADASLAKLFIDMQSSQVAGFYDPDAKELFVVSRSGSLGPTERVTFAHEYTHALQDQNFDLKTFDLQEVGQGDRGLARLSLIEGDATAVMTVWAQQNLNAVELLQLAQDSADPEALRILESLPPILRETTLFPYQTGVQFVLSLEGTGGEKAVDDAFGDPPASSEQIMHFEKYEAREKPVAVSLPKDLAARMGTGWKLSLQDTLGEFELGVWLRGGSDRAAIANEAAAGWGGDRVGLLEGPGNSWAIVMMTAWDTPQDALEFRSAAAQALDAYKTPASSLAAIEGSKQTLILASNGTSLQRLTRALGLP